jgi:zinc transport system permease protein
MVNMCMEKDVNMTEIILYPLLLSIPLALLVGPVGSILVWRRSSFLADVVSHMGILAFAIAEITQLPILIVSVCVSTLVALMLEWAPSFIPKDAWLAGVSSLGISIGLLLLSSGGAGHGFDHVFWGDMFALTQYDIIVFGIATGFLGMHLIVFWRSLVLIMFHEELAILDGVPVRFVKGVNNVIAGVVIALSLKVMGVLLTGALFVLPSIGLRFLNLTPERHVLGAITFVFLAFVAGVIVSVQTDAIAAPWIIFALVVLNFAVIFLKKGIDIRREK